MKEFVDANKDHIIFYNNIHSYSQLILHPYGYTTDPIPEFDEVNGAANRVRSDFRALLKTAVPEFKSSALLGQNSRDIFFSPNGGRTGTAVLSSA